MEFPGLLYWIDSKKLDWAGLSLNPNPIAIYILSQNLNKIGDISLSMNKNIKDFSNKEFINNLIMNDTYGIIMEQLSIYSNDMEILKQNFEKIHWDKLSTNKNAIEILKANPEKIDWVNLSRNPNAIELLKMHPENINWYNLSSNPNAIELLKENPEKIEWKILSGNPNAIELLKENPEKIKWSMVCTIQKKEAIDLIRNNLEKKHYNYLDWCALSCNPFAIELLKENPKRIHWDELSLNPAIFQYNYQEMKINNEKLMNEVIEMALNPIRINDLMDRYGRDIVYDTYFEM